ncbi:Oidioi.mRNA.OKI2018_I69.PAR.g9068.t1.cds [Oikopleura dioica]|uniref:Oidioi.mRNA.OKI2018_I69.PAR.g9068.t1.cds n=1 Tax=Oikopleura dioica TaxID=34765 RepID=A0ABN7RPT1_OIKDI|nr:Oidioi.mRNA.OKI2018_I69.PAR.g9068.t1.cds [Oikopleura dioica]
MKLRIVFSLAAAVSAVHKTFVGSDRSVAYPIYCDEQKSEIESLVPTFSEEGPAISVRDGKAIVNGYLSNEYLFNTIYDCTMRGGRTEQVLLLAILEPSDVKVISSNFDPNSKKSEKLATCTTGETYPQATIQWLNDQGNIVFECNENSKLDANDCFVDYSGTGVAKENRYRSSTVDASLRAEIDASEKYQCRVVYQKLVDGQSVESYLDSPFPAEGCIAGPCSKKVVDLPVDPPTETHRDSPNEDTPNPIEDPAEEEIDVDAAGNGNKTFLVGSVTGIVIIAIIIAVIFYVKKRGNEDEDGTKYTEGAQTEA